MLILLYPHSLTEYFLSALSGNADITSMIVDASKNLQQHIDDKTVKGYSGTRVGHVGCSEPPRGQPSTWRAGEDILKWHSEMRRERDSRLRMVKDNERG